MGEKATKVAIMVVGDTSKAREELKKLDDATGTTEGKFSKFSGAMGKAMSAIGGAAILQKTADYMRDAGQAAADEEQEMAVLAKTLENTTGATDAQKTAVEGWITATQNATGISDGQLRPALSNLVVATGDVGEAQELMATAMDIAVAKGLDLETVTKAMSKAHEGNTGALSKLGIETKNAAGEAASFDEIMQNANETFGGAAATAADTTAGKMAIMGNKMADLKETIGAALLPVMDKLTSALGTLLGWFDSLSPGMQQAIGIALAVAAGLAGVAMVVGPLLSGIGALTAILPALGTAFTIATGPIGLIVLGIAAVIAIGVLLWKHWDDVSAFATEIWGKIKETLVGAWDAIKGAFDKAMDFMEGLWTTTWNGVRDAVAGLWDGIGGALSTAWTTFTALVSGLWDWIGTTWASVWGAVSDALTGLWDTIRGSFQTVWDAFTGFVSPLWDWLTAQWNYVWGLVSSALTVLWDAIKFQFDLVWGTFKAIVTGDWDELKVLWEDAWTKVKDALAGVWDGIKSAFSTVWDGFKTWVVGLWGKLWDDGEGNGIGAELAALWDKIKEFFEGIPEKIQTALTGLADKIASPFKGLWGAIFGGGGVNDGIDSLMNAYGQSQGSIGVGTEGLKPDAARIARMAVGRFPTTLISGYRQDAQYPNDHPSGRAIDLAATGALGDAIKNWALTLPEANIVLWNQRQWFKDGSSRFMADRGSVSANHLDHVHIRTYKIGGVVPGMGPQPAIVHGGERILTARQEKLFERLITAMGNGGRAGGNTFYVSGNDGLSVGRQIAATLAGV